MQESSDPRLPCLHYDVTVTSNGDLQCKFLPYGIVAVAPALNSSDLAQGFKINMDFDLLNGSSWNIFATDYSEIKNFKVLI